MRGQPLAELKRVDAGAWKSPKFAGERIPTLAEVLAIVPRGKQAFLELKTGPDIVPAVAKIIQRGPVPMKRLTVIAFDRRTVAACRAAMPDVACNWLVYIKKDSGGRITPTTQNLLRTLSRIGASGLDLEAVIAALTPTTVRGLRDAGYGLHVWTVDTVAKAKAFAARGVDSITTNKPATIGAALREVV